MKQSKDYWADRAAQRMFEHMEDAEKTAARIAGVYRKASEYLQKRMEGIFLKFMRKHGLTQAEAKRLLSGLGKDPSAKDILDRLSAAGIRQEAGRALAEEIEAPAYRARMERLHELQDQVDAMMSRVYRQEERISSDFYRELTEDAFYRSTFDVQQQAGIAAEFAHLDEDAVDKILNSRWSGENFSSRIWNNTSRLAQELKESLLVDMITGRTERDAAQRLVETFSVGAMQARRLVRTESCFLTNQMNMRSFREAGVEEYLYVATLDMRTSEICRELDGERFPVADQLPGTNCPPMHPWCRSTTIPFISEEVLAKMKRRARDPETGRTYTVPANMTYKQWYEKYVEGKAKPEGVKQEGQQEKQERNLTKEQFERYRSRGIGPESYEEFIRAKSDPEAWAKMQAEYREAGKKEQFDQDGLKADIPKRDLSKVAAVKPKAEDKRRVINKAGKEVVFDFKSVNDSRQKQIDVISELTTEYNTRLERVTYGAGKSAGDVDISGATMRLSDSHEYTAVHEFAHTLANTDADKYGLTQNQEFWKEIKKIRREYHKDVDAAQDPSRFISGYEHSSKSVDEFFAEAFTHAKLREMGLPIPDKYGQDFTYSQRVLDTVDRYFKKETFLLRNNVPHGFVDTRTIGDPITQTDLKSFIKKANSKGIRIGVDLGSTGNFDLYCGDPKVLDDVVDHLGKSIDEAKKAGLMGINDDVILRYDNVLGYKGDNSAIDIGAFAETKGKTITLNKFMFDDTNYLKFEYNESVGNYEFARGTSIKNIVDHELGHIIDKKNPRLRARVISVLQEEALSANISLDKLIKEQVSIYALSSKENNWLCELVPELYAMSKGSQPNYAIDLFRKAGVPL